MDQTAALSRFESHRSAGQLADFVAHSVEVAPAAADPFYHLEFERVFPDDIYARMLALMPNAADYRPMHGRSKVVGTPTRVKIDLFPEYIRHLPAEKRALWTSSAARCDRRRSSAPSSIV